MVRLIWTRKIEIKIEMISHHPTSKMKAKWTKKISVNRVTRSSNYFADYSYDKLADAKIDFDLDRRYSISTICTEKYWISFNIWMIWKSLLQFFLLRVKIWWWIPDAFHFGIKLILFLICLLFADEGNNKFWKAAQQDTHIVSPLRSIILSHSKVNVCTMRLSSR